ncbi:amidophosphoribosyltransferase [Marivirga tractuosa]|nr:phosphoribosyltransferase family protein [Marivirga tractuosa]BDD16966.1 amidophosphoribosyltransferase [Marivirga tractuosa]
MHTDQPNQLHKRFFEIPNLKYAMSFAWFQKGSVIQNLLHQLKYEGNEAIGVLLGELYGDQLSDIYSEKWDIITAVPIHIKKRRQRGFNQSHRIAEGLSHRLSIPFVPLLEKSVHKRSQTRKHRIDRFSNVESTFQLKKASTSLKGKRILLVDDVLTTGATVQACSEPLQKAGAEISIVTISATKN